MIKVDTFDLENETLGTFLNYVYHYYCDYP